MADGSALGRNSNTVGMDNNITNIAFVLANNMVYLYAPRLVLTFIWPIPLTETLNNPVFAAQQNLGY
jgi:hypothetical protein